jgi:tetrahydromethanopterin S-methyltransferase subunit A
MEEAKARFKETTDIVDKIEAEDAKGVWADVC